MQINVVSIDIYNNNNMALHLEFHEYFFFIHANKLMNIFSPVPNKQNLVCPVFSLEVRHNLDKKCQLIIYILFA